LTKYQKNYTFNLPDSCSMLQQGHNLKALVEFQVQQIKGFIY